MNKKNLLGIMAFMIIIASFSACGINENMNTVTEKTAEDSKSKISEEEPKQKEYEISKKIYTDGNLRVEYPQIINLTDNEKQEEINNLIKNEALVLYQKTIKELEPNQKYEVDGKYEIKYNSQNLLSIAYSSYNNVSTYAHPYNLFYTTNIDMRTGEKLYLKDLLPLIDKTFVDFLKKAKYIGEIDKEYEHQIRDQAFSIYESDEKLIDVLYSNEDQDSIYVYVTKDALGISLPVPHVMRDHAEFEININDLKGFIIM